MTTFTTTQHDAIRYTDSPLMIVGASGTGKTTLLAHKIAYLLEAVATPSLIAMSGSAHALNDWRAWTGEIVGNDVLKVQFNRIELVCLGWLRSHAALAGLAPHFTVFDPIESIRVAIEILNDPQFDGIGLAPRDLVARIHRDSQHVASTADDRHDTHRVDLAMTQYREYLRRSNAINVEDILALTLRLFQTAPDIRQRMADDHPVWLIDHGEDLSPVAVQLIREAVDAGIHVTVAIDPGQRISDETMEGYDPFTDLATVPGMYTIELLELWGRTPVINTLVNALSTSPQPVTDVSQETDKVTVMVTASELEESQYILQTIESMRREKRWSYNDFCILYRAGSHAVYLEEQLRLHAIRLRSMGRHTPFGHSEIRDLMLYLRLLMNPCDRQALAQLLSIAPFQLTEPEISTVLTCMPTHSDGVFDLQDTDRLSDSVQPKILGLVDLLTHWEAEIKENPDILAGVVLDNIARDSGYRSLLDEENTLESLDQLQSIDEFIDAAIENEWTVDQVFTQVTTQQLSDDAPTSGDAVTLMPLKSSKSRRFRCVFIPGFEEGTLPHGSAIDRPDLLAQERRYVYLGISRATHHLSLCASFQRHVGHDQPTQLSRFAYEWPSQCVGAMVSESVTDSQRTGLTRWVEMNGNTLDNWTPTGGSGGGKSFQEFTVGEWIDHGQWGKGIVQSIEGSEDKLVLNIQFTDHTRKVMAKYADVKRL